jgi:predicted nucleic acid-binding protein
MGQFWVIVNTYLLDTNAYSYLIRGRAGDADPRCQAVFAKAQATQQNTQLAICAITVGEVEYGLQCAHSPNADLQREVRAHLAAFPLCLVIDKNTAADYYARIRAEIFKKFSPTSARGARLKKKWPEELDDPTTAKTLGIQENDLWIVAVALSYNLILVTADNMERITSIVGSALTIEDWTIA